MALTNILLQALRASSTGASRTGYRSPSRTGYRRTTTTSRSGGLLGGLLGSVLGGTGASRSSYTTRGIGRRTTSGSSGLLGGLLRGLIQNGQRTTTTRRTTRR